MGKRLGGKSVNRTRFGISYVIAVSLLLMLLVSVPAYAEGSRDLTAFYNQDNGTWQSNVGYRPYLEWYDSAEPISIQRECTVYVYANKGESIIFGSSVYDSYDGNDVVLRTPSGQVRYYDVESSGKVLSLTTRPLHPTIRQAVCPL